MANNSLTLPANSAYADGYIVNFSDGESVLLREPKQYTGDTDDSYYTVKEGDSIDRIAWLMYSGQIDDASKFWRPIADANYIMNPLDLSDYVGQNLLIPNIHKVLLNL